MLKMFADFGGVGELGAIAGCLGKKAIVVVPTCISVDIIILVGYLEVSEPVRFCKKKAQKCNVDRI